MKHPLSSLLSPSSIAVFGPIDRPGSQAYEWWHLLRHGQQKVVGIEPQLAGSTHESAFVSLSQAGFQPDIAIITNSTPREAIIECEYAGVPVAVLTSPKLGDIPVTTKTSLLQPGAFGFMRPSQALGVSCLPIAKPGNVAIISQSGLVATQILDQLCQGGRGCSFFTVVPSHCVAQLNQLLWLLEHDEETAVIGLYLEQLPKDRQLLAALDRLCHHKPIVVLANQKLPAAGLESILYAQSGAVMAESLQSFYDLVVALSGDDEATTLDKPQDSSHHWRYHAAMRYFDTDLDMNSWSQHAGDLSAAWPDAGPVAPPSHHIAKTSLSSSWPYVAATTQSSSTFSAQDKQEWRQLAQRLLPTYEPMALDLLSQAKVPIKSGMWVHDNQPLDVQAKQAGWPLRLYALLPNGQTAISPVLRSLGSLHQYVRRIQRLQSTSLWLQQVPRSDWEISLTAYRDTSFGPLLYLQNPLTMDRTMTALLPLSEDRIQTTLDRHLNPIVSAYKRPLAEVVHRLGQVVVGIPEISHLQVEVAMLDGLALTYTAKLSTDTI